jgi:cytoskeletal protein CcmA (bactofilin family)
MFNFKKNQENLTIISKGTVFKGELSSSDDIFVEGTVNTSNLIGKTITVGAGGVVEATLIKASTIVIYGSVKANVVSDNVVIVKGGSLKGDITYKKLSIEETSKVEGSFKSMAKENFITGGIVSSD